MDSNSIVLRFLYHTSCGRSVLKVLTLPALSKAAGVFMDSRFSVPLIDGFIKNNNIDMSEFEERDFVSFNDFFTRHVKNGKRPVDMSDDSFIAPCDGNLTVYNIYSDGIYHIKNSSYKISDLLRSEKLAKKFENGYMMVFRLCVDNYHRYHYLDDGIKSVNRSIPGILHTVMPIAVNSCNVYCENSREYTLLRTKNFGDVIQMEVGAMLVGKIKNHHEKHRFKRGEEKGMFLYGGSTIILLVEPGKVMIDDDILTYSANGIETPVKFGQKLGEKKF